ncbi:MAG: glycosyltransferase family 2 protein [Chryseolinea sp.]
MSFARPKPSAKETFARPKPLAKESLAQPKPSAKASLAQPKPLAKASVVILNYNGAALLQQFLPLVVQHSGTASIFIVDNASTDDSLEFVERNFTAVRIIRLDKNYGYAGGYNRALREIQSEYYILLNSDIEVTTGWLDPMVRILDQEVSVAALQPKILSYREKNKFEHAGAAGGFIDSLGYPFCRGRIFDYVEFDKGQYNDECEIFWASGACLVIRSQAFHQFNGFDEDYFAHMEEIDLCWKLHRANMRVVYCPSSTIYHVGAGTMAYGSPRKIFLNFRNGLLMIFKHLSTTELFYKIPIRLCLDWVAFIKYFLSGELKNSAAILRAHGAFLSNIPRELRKRNELLSAYPTYQKKGIMRPGSIVFDYYIRRKKTFDQ